MQYDPRESVKTLSAQGNTVQQSKDEDGNTIYWVNVKGLTYRLTAQDLYDLQDRGKLTSAGIIEHG